eukprot:NODE_2791_length_874_cov_317.373626.p2 GENE.NODE_2791_length_874_cov_317.373626~~NODE_2791_length_874_cov_317.373626.p2  ORF type:complete len:258 (-),score=51.66 NODE_2791_length_874_cov_317.373626:62-835(-)
MHYAVQNGHVECLRMLIDSGASKDVSKPDGATPTFVAAQDGHVECLRLLLAAGANADAALNVSTVAPMYSGATPTFIAADRGRVECVRALLAAGANAAAPTHNGQTPLDIARAKEHEASAAERSVRAAVVEALLRAGMQPDMPFGGTGFGAAAPQERGTGLAGADTHNDGEAGVAPPSTDTASVGPPASSTDAVRLEEEVANAASAGSGAAAEPAAMDATADPIDGRERRVMPGTSDTWHCFAGCVVWMQRMRAPRI